MPSRKKAKGQARKAAKVKKEEEELLAEKAREEEELYRELEQSQIQRLQISDQKSVLPLCLHGFNPFSNDDICIKFIRSFVHKFYELLCKLYNAGMKVEIMVTVCLLQTGKSTQDEYSEVWNSSAKIKQVIKYFLYSGTMDILDENNHPARHSAILARFFEQRLKVKVHKSHPYIDWLKVLESALGDERTVLKFFWRRIRCSCLDKAYEEAKSIPKKGTCFNLLCSHQNRFVERSKLRCCSRCRSVNYCSRECQVADWSLHKSFCDEVAATRAEFDASQQQQS